jgi:CheY-like chemotaxis protein
MSVNSVFEKRNKTVMAVDDTPEMLAMIKEVIVEAGYNFVGARSGEQCIMRLATERPNFFLLDVQMPGMDGFELCRRIRARPEWGDVPIAFLTAFKSEQSVRQGIAAGGNDFVGKPFTVKTLLRHVDHWAFRRVGQAKAS